MVKERKMRLTAVVLAVVMLLGMVSAVVLAQTGIIAKAANVAVFSLSIVSETSSEVKVSFNLESGSFTAMDWQVNASDWNRVDRTTGLTLTSIERAQNYKDFVSLHEENDIPPIFTWNKNTGRVSFATIYPYDVIGSMFIFTFKKTSSAKANVSPSDFLAEITSCGDCDNNSCTPELINKIPEPPTTDPTTTERTTTEPTTTEWTTTTKWTTTTEPDDVTTTERATTKWDDVTTTKPAAEAPVFSVTKISETKDEVKLSFNLESGSFTALDWQVNASDWNHVDRTTGLTLSSIEKAQNYKDFVSLHGDDDVTPMVVFNKANGRASFGSRSPYDVIGSMFIFTFKKTSSAKANVSPSDFYAKIDLCTDCDNNFCTPKITLNWEVEECKHVFSHITATATCSSEGSEYDICTKCREIFNYTKIAKKAHAWSSWTTTVQPTVKTEGYEVRMCTVCETVETRKIPKITANVKAVSFSDITLNYKKSTTITPNITADKDAEYTVKYSSSNTSVARVDDNGNVYAAKRGSATITCTVTDSNDNTVQDTCNVTVKYSFGQWLIVILLFGWIWY